MPLHRIGTSRAEGSTMKRSRLLAAFVSTAVMAVAALLALRPSAPQASGQAAQPPRKERRAAAPIAMPAGAVGLEITLGLKDAKPADWEGEIQVSEGKVLNIDVVQSGPDAKAKGPRFSVSSAQRMAKKKK